MNENVAFTICAKNYLAQALTLKESFQRHNQNCDFFLFLSDDSDGLTEKLSDIILLDDKWIPGWKRMAFKYNVIEFSTSIKPFCFKKLFDERYSKVIYLDPDTYVTNNLYTIYDFLEEKSIVLTPHICNIQTKFTGSVPEEEILFVGIYNLGFGAIKNDIVGNKIVNWWMNRLADKCYADKFDALHVDQKWMDFIPSFFPNDTLITHHLGLNPAIWNLHERELIISDNDQYQIKDTTSQEVFPLLFFHFSGFDPYNPKMINRRHPMYNTEFYPSYVPLFGEYVKGIYANGYDKYSQLFYSFNAFQDGENILPLYRRLFRSFERDFSDANPFESDSLFYKKLEKAKLLTGVRTLKFSSYTDKERNSKSTYVKMIFKSFNILKRVLGIRYYYSLIVFLHEFSRLENQGFLLNGNEENR